MKATDLMFGDWVYDKKHQANGTVTTTTRVLLWVALDNDDHNQLNYDEVEPIPLTTEILEKNGFELRPDGWLWCKDKENEEQDYIFIQFRKGCDEVRLCKLNFTGRVQATFRSIYDVHELQHALRLCHINKEIQP